MGDPLCLFRPYASLIEELASKYLYKSRLIYCLTNFKVKYKMI